MSTFAHLPSARLRLLNLLPTVAPQRRWIAFADRERYTQSSE